jgi:hypothetical protein
MVKKFDKASIPIFVFLVFFGLVGLFGAIYFCNNVNYSGKVMITHNQYEEFKSIAIKPNHEINKLQIMNSEPVYIDFSMWVPANEQFPFGERGDVMRIIAIILCSVIVISSPFLACRAIKDFGFKEVNLNE